MPSTKVETVVLALLAEEELYGYELLDRLRDRGMPAWLEVGRASVYQALRRLEGTGALVGRSERGVEGPDRRVYRLTQAGSGHLRKALIERFSDAGPRERPVDLAMGFLHLLPPDTIRSGVAERERALAERRTSLAAERVRLEAEGGRGHRDAARLVELHEALARAELEWLAALRHEGLNAGGGSSD